MLAQIWIVTGQVLTLFLMIGVGFAISRLKKIKDSSIPDITWLMTRVSLPCAIIRSLMVDNSPEFLRSISYAFVVITVITLAAAFLSQLCYRKRAKEQRTVLQMGMVYGNSAFMGIALVQAVLGEGAVIYATLIVIVETILMLLQCELTMSEGKPSIRKALLTPGVIGFVIGMTRLLLNIKLPAPITSTITTMSGMNTPLAMIIVGMQMGKVDLRTIFTQKDLYSCALFKLVLQPAALSLLLLPVGLAPIAYSTIVICKGTTQAAVIAAYAQDHGQDAVLGSQLIALTSILQILTLPLIAVLARVLGGF